MANSFQRARTTVVLMGIASLLTGVVILLNPAGVALFLTALFGGVLAIAGAVTLVGYARARDVSTQSDLFVGLVELVFGAILWFWPGMFVNWLVVIVGVFILFSGLGDFAEARSLAALGAPAAGMGTVLAVLTVIFGVLVVASPFALVDLMFSIAGFGLVFNGVTELVAAFRM